MGHIQQNLNYKAARSTRLLNNHIKDNFGQQRPVVLFGFKVTPGPTSNSVNIGAGAILTHNGQKVFAYDPVVTTVNLTQGSGSIVEMYVVAMRHNYVADTSVNEPVFEIVRVKDWLPRDVAPIKDIREINIINGTVNAQAPTLEHSLFTIGGLYAEGLNVGDFNTDIYGEDEILGYDQIPIAKIIVNRSLAPTDIVSAGAWATGVALQQYKNPFEQLMDYIGLNYFEPAHEDADGNVMNNERWYSALTPVGNDPFYGQSLVTVSGGVSIDHDYCKFGFYYTGGEHRTPTNNPLYGFYDIDGLNKALYAYASFMDDGHSMKWNLQRLSETIRAIDSIVGSHPDQSLMRTLQNIPPKDIHTLVVNNLIPCVYNEDANECFLINSGNTGWFKPPIGDANTYSATHDYDGLGTFGLGDNHHTAIAVLDKSISYLWHNRLGLIGETYGTGVNKAELRTYSANVSADNFDKELWDATSISGDVDKNATFHDAIQNIIDNKLHRSDDLVYGWTHFGTDTSQNRTTSAALTNFETSQGAPAWIKINGENSIYCASAPIHISGEGFFVQKYNAFNIRYGVGVNDIMAFKSNFGVSAFMSDTVSQTSGIHYPGVITVTTNVGGSEYSGTYSGNLLARSTIVGGDALNLTTKSYYDVEILSNGTWTGGTNFLCTISWSSPYGSSQSIPDSSGLVTATIASCDVVSGVCTTKVRLGNYVSIKPAYTFFPNPTSTVPFFSYQQRYATPWNLLEISKNINAGQTISGYNIGLSTITLFGIDYPIRLNENEFSASLCDYNDNVNTVDRFDGEAIVSLPTKKGSQSLKALFRCPVQVTDWISMGDDYEPLTYPTSKGSIIGNEVNIFSDTSRIKSTNLYISAGNAYFNGSVSLGDSSVGGETNIHFKNGKLYVGSGCEIIMETGSKITLRDGSGIYQEYGSTIAATSNRNKTIFSKQYSIINKNDIDNIGTDADLTSRQSDGALNNHFSSLADWNTFNAFPGQFYTAGVFQAIYNTTWSHWGTKNWHTFPYSYTNYPGANYYSWPFEAANSITPTKITLSFDIAAHALPLPHDAKTVYIDLKLYPFVGDLTISYTWSNVPIVGHVCYAQYGAINYSKVLTTTDAAFLSLLKNKIDPGPGGPAVSDKIRIDIAKNASSDKFTNLTMFSCAMYLDYAVNSR